MARYHLKQPVDWRAVMAALRWCLLMRKEQYLRMADKSHAPKGPAGRFRKYLKTDLAMYQGLRSFLGYSKPARIEREMMELLEEETEKRD